MKIEAKSSDGLILKVISKILNKVASPLDCSHNILKKFFIKTFSRYFGKKGWKYEKIVNVFLEL